MEFLHNFQTMFFKDLDAMSLVIMTLLLSFIVMFWRGQATGKIDWIDLIKKPRGQEISLTKVIQLVGAIVATWMMVKMTIDGKMSSDIFAVYLMYVAGVEGFSKFVSAKYNFVPNSLSQGSSKSTVNRDDEEQAEKPPRD